MQTLKVVLGMGNLNFDCFDFLSFVEVPPWAPLYPWVDPLDPWVGPLDPWVITIGFHGLPPGLPWTCWAPLDPWAGPLGFPGPQHTDRLTTGHYCSRTDCRHPERINRFVFISQDLVK